MKSFTTEHISDILRLNTSVNLSKRDSKMKGENYGKFEQS